MSLYEPHFKKNDEAARLENLRKYEILDTPPDNVLDNLTKLTAKLLKVPVAIISLVDEDRIWFKSRYGLPGVTEVPREIGLCASAILFDEFYIIEDTQRDPRTSDHSLVTSSFGLRFYASVPLTTKEGYNIGSFCVMDKVPRKLEKDEEIILLELTNTIMEQIELKLLVNKTKNRHKDILHLAAHDLKNPLTLITLQSSLIPYEDDTEEIGRMCQNISDAARKMTRIIDDILVAGSADEGKIPLQLHPISLSRSAQNVIEANRPSAENKSQLLSFTAESEVVVKADKGKLSEIIDNLVNNAIKYSPHDKHISVTVNQNGDKGILKVRDEGPGLTRMDKKNMFQRFTRLSAQPTGGESSTGLGLSITKSLVEAHQGRVYAESDGKGKGTTFIVELPLFQES